MGPMSGEHDWIFRSCYIELASPPSETLGCGQNKRHNYESCRVHTTCQFRQGRATESSRGRAN